MDLRDCQVLRAGPVRTVPEVVDRLTGIRDCTGRAAPECGISYFSDLYLTITQAIWGHIRSGTFFADDEYLARLDVHFGNRYFDALRVWAGGARPPRAWQVLFDVPTNGEVTALQLAGAGVNAHVNLDLAVASVDAGREMGDADLDTAGRRDDYRKVNDVFAEQMDTLLRRLLDERAAAGQGVEPLSALGRVMTRIVAAARRFAWEDAEVLWALPRRSAAWTVKEQQMDAVASLIGQALLVDLPG